MPLDPGLRAFFDKMPKLPEFKFWRLAPGDARAALRQVIAYTDTSDTPIGKVEDIEIPAEGRVIPARVYTPVAGGSSLPALVFFHGGGFALGDIETYDNLCRSLANDSGCRLISVGYRLAPENPFPAAVDDAFAAVGWVEKNASTLGIDPNRLAVGGDSAGGNLTAVVTHLARAKGVPGIAFQLLIYPLVTLREPNASFKDFTAGYFFNLAPMNWLRDHYVPRGEDLFDVKLSPLEATNFSGLPPAYIVTAGIDPLREQGAAYAEKLKAAGVPVTYVDYPSVLHGFMSMQAAVPLAREAIAAAGKAVKTALAPP